MTAFIVDRIPDTAECFTEPLDGLDDAISLDMVLVPGGTNTMGSPADEPERFDDEGPQHEVTIPRFFIGRYPITQAQWRAVAALEPVDIDLEPEPSEFKGADRPVERVSWYEAVEFCERLAKKTKRLYRLPSEAEWEYACRAGTQTPFAFGKMITTEIVNYNGSYTYNNGPEGESRGETTPVDFFGVANAFGLSDMHGNVWEWCADHWRNNYNNSLADGSSWVSNNKEDSRILRGGSWDVNPRNCRAATRVISPPAYRNNYVGFRICCAAPRALP